MPEWSPEAIGYVGQSFYGLRALIQWIQSERARRVVVPRTFWYLGLAGVCCALIYGVLDHNAVFVFAVLPTLYVYSRNLLLKGSRSRWELLPIAVLLVSFIVWAAWVKSRDGDDPLWLAIGFFGAVVYSGRYVVQWWISERLGRSTLPRTFWIQSIAGSMLLLAYGIHERMGVVIVAFALAWIPYARNLALSDRNRTRCATDLPQVASRQ